MSVFPRGSFESILTGWQAVTIQNTTLMANAVNFSQYSPAAEPSCEFFFSYMFSSRCLGHKMIPQPLQPLDCENRLLFYVFIYFLFYCPKHRQLYKSDSRPFLSCGSWQKYHVCLSPERIYSADSLASTPATAGGIRFSLYLFPSFFRPALREVSQVIPGEKFLQPPLRSPVK